VLWRCWLGGRKGIRPVKSEWWGAGVVICLERGADLHTAQLMPLPLTVSCFSKIQIGFTFLLPAHLCVCVCVRACVRACVRVFSVGMTFSLHFVFYLILYISALVSNKRVHSRPPSTSSLYTLLTDCRRFFSDVSIKFPYLHVIYDSWNLKLFLKILESSCNLVVAAGKFYN